ncbi:hypothetical protein [Coleofasciculus chthonoplastes]|uniref:hypothetical protein n=1 Tax=Coleofasciculus chthonoplastes TaxID=64178 RepID=UPI0032F7D203
MKFISPNAGQGRQAFDEQELIQVWVVFAYTEVLDFLITRPTPQEITTFKISAEAQERLRTLLDKNREGTLTETEATELDLYEQLEHLMILLKAKAYDLIG